MKLRIVYDVIDGDRRAPQGARGLKYGALQIGH